MKLSIRELDTDKRTYLKRAVFAACALAVFAAWTLFWYAECDRKIVFVAAVAFGFLPVAAFVLHVTGILSTAERRLAAFGALLGLSCALFAVAFPPFTAPDEFHHYLASYWVADCITGEANLDSPHSMTMREDDWQLFTENEKYSTAQEISSATATINAAAYQTIFDDFSWGLESNSVRVLDESIASAVSINGDNLPAKIGSALGILLAKLFGLGAYPLFYLGRLFSAAFFVACAVAAIRITPVGKSVFAAVSLLPMVLHLAASYSYDGGIIGIAFLFTACMLNAIFGKGRIHRAILAGGVICAALLAPCKIVYAFLFLLVFAIPSKRFSSTKIAWLYKLGVLVVGAAAIAAIRIPTLGIVTTSSALSAFPGETSYSLSIALENPLSTIALFARTLDVEGETYLLSALGYVLGWMQADLAMPALLMLGYLACILVAAQRSSEDMLVLPPAFRAISFTLPTLAWFASMASMLFAWTPLSSSTIGGVQGRYLLPALPLLLLSLRSKRFIIEGPESHRLLFTLLALNAFYMVRFFAKAFLA